MPFTSINKEVSSVLTALQPCSIPAMSQDVFFVPSSSCKTIRSPRLHRQRRSLLAHKYLLRPPRPPGPHCFGDPRYPFLARSFSNLFIFTTKRHPSEEENTSLGNEPRRPLGCCIFRLLPLSNSTPTHNFQHCTQGRSPGVTTQLSDYST